MQHHEAGNSGGGAGNGPAADGDRGPHQGEAPRSDEGFIAVFLRISSAACGLIRDEAALAKAEVSRAAKDAVMGIAQLVVALILVFVALIVLAGAMVLALVAFGLSPVIAALVVGVVLLLIALALVQMALRLLSPKNLTPHRTIENLRRDMETLKALGRPDE